MTWYSWMIMAVVFYTLGDLFLKLYGNTGRVEYAICEIICFCISGGLWLPIIRKYNSIIITGTIYDIITVVAMMAIGLSLGEHFTMKQWIGIVLGTVSLFLLI